MKAAASLLSADWGQLAATAAEALAAGSLDVLEEVDAVVHHRFIEALHSGDQRRQEFLDQIYRITGSREARGIARPEGTARLLTQWSHLGALVEAMRRKVDPVEKARQFVNTREHARTILARIDAAEAEGVQFGALAAEMPLEKSNLSRLLTEMEEHNLIEREREGRNVFLFLGLAAQVIRASEKERVDRPITQATLERYLHRRIRPDVQQPRAFFGLLKKAG